MRFCCEANVRMLNSAIFVLGITTMIIGAVYHNDSSTSSTGQNAGGLLVAASVLQSAQAVVNYKWANTTDRYNIGLLMGATGFNVLGAGFLCLSASLTNPTTASAFCSIGLVLSCLGAAYRVSQSCGLFVANIQGGAATQPLVQYGAPRMVVSASTV